MKKSSARWRLRCVIPSLTRLTPACAVNDEIFNLSLRKFLKMPGLSSQNEIETQLRRYLIGFAEFCKS